MRRQRDGAGCLREAVDRVPLFAGLTSRQRDEVASFACHVTVPQGQQVQAASGEVHQLLIVIAGNLRVVHVDTSGREQVVRILGPGDFIGETSFVLRQPPEHFAYAVGLTQLCVLEHRHLTALTARSPHIAIHMLQVTMRRLLSAERQLATFAGSRVSPRFAAYLLDLPRRRDGAGRIIVRLPLAQKDIASYLGTTPETLSRRVRELIAGGIIARQGRRDIVLIDPDALAQRAARRG